MVAMMIAFAGCASEQKVEWSNDFQGALNIAKNEERNILLVLSKDSCPWCQKLKNETLKDKAVLDLIKKNFVFVLLESPQDSTQISLNNLSSRSVPATILLDSKGREFGRLVGYMGATTYIAEIEALLK